MRVMVRLSKAYKQGLVAIQKQVTKKGKVFTQTFYVKPLEAPKPEKAPVVKEQEKTKGSSPSEDRSYWNAPDGFYAIMHGEHEDYRVRIPAEGMLRKIVFRGRTFFIARAMFGDADKGTISLSHWRAYDPKSGWAITTAMETPEDVMEILNGKIAQIPDERWNSTIDNAKPITDINKVYDKPVKIMDEFAPVTDFKDAATQLMDKMDKDSQSIDGYLIKDDIATWLQGQVYNQRDLRWLLEDEIEHDILVVAVRENISIDNAKDQELTIEKLVVSAPNATYDPQNINRADVIAWAKAKGVNLINGIDFDSIGVADDEYDISFSGEEVAAYAVTHNMSLGSAYDHFNAILQEKRDEEIERTSFSDSFGNEWDASSLIVVGQWITGTVQPNRTAAKELFLRRENGFSEPSGTHNLIGVVERHLMEFTPSVDTPALYRGTKNGNWADVVAGDVIPFGLGSFSKSKTAADEFTVGPILIMEAEGLEKPIVGLDVNQLAADGKEEGGSTLIHNFNIDEYANEQEFIVLAPSLEILRVEKEAAQPYSTHDPRTLVYVKPIKTELIQYMKSKFESRAKLIEELERTFDEPLHREPEGA